MARLLRDLADILDPPAGEPLHMPAEVTPPEPDPSTPAPQASTPEVRSPALPASLTQLERDILDRLAVIPRPLKADALSKRMGRGKANTYFFHCIASLKDHDLVVEADDGGLWPAGRPVGRAPGVGT